MPFETLLSNEVSFFSSFIFFLFFPMCFYFNLSFQFCVFFLNYWLFNILFFSIFSFLVYFLFLIFFFLVFNLINVQSLRCLFLYVWCARIASCKVCMVWIEVTTLSYSFICHILSLYHQHISCILEWRVNFGHVNVGNYLQCLHLSTFLNSNIYIYIYICI
jgi:hypothetical protein